MWNLYNIVYWSNEERDKWVILLIVTEEGGIIES